MLEVLSTEELETVLDRVQRSRVASLAICLLYAYANPVHEAQLAQAAPRQPAKSGENTLVHHNRRRKLPSKFNMRVEAGDRLIIATPGGGGYGAGEQRQGGKPDDMVDVFKESNVDAALAASIFHYNTHGVNGVKTYLKDKEIPVRL